MKLRACVFLAVLVALSTSLEAQSLKIAVMDFSLESDNPQYKYLGKGFTELVSVEVSRLPGFVLVDRERRNAILEELEFALSGAADTADAMKIGQLLSVEYFVVGSIIDMMGNLVVSYSIIRTDTGAVVGKQAAEGSPKDYKPIVKAISLGIATMAGKESAIAKAQAAPALAAPVARQEEVLTSFSDAVAALDVKDVKTATAKLKIAKSIDPTDQAVQFYMDKLAAGSAKFKVVPERYVTYYNPAYLGGMTKDRLYFNYFMTWIQGGKWQEHNNTYLILNPDGSYGAAEAQFGGFFGYAYPLSPRFSMALDGVWMSNSDSVILTAPVFEGATYGSDNSRYLGLMLTGGLIISPNISLGGGAAYANKSREYYNYYIDPTWNTFKARQDVFGGMLAVALKNDSGSLAWDIVGAYGNEALHWYDLSLPLPDFVQYGVPIYVEQTLTFVLNKKTTFLALKQANDFYLDRDLYYGRAMPCVEQWFFDLFSLRAGAEGTMFARDGGIALGWGATGGATLRIWKFDIDANYTFRQRPARTLDETVIPESVLFFTVSLNGLLKN